MILKNKTYRIFKECSKKHDCKRDIKVRCENTYSCVVKKIKKFKEMGLLKEEKNGDRNKKVKLTRKGWKVLRLIEEIKEAEDGQD